MWLLRSCGEMPYPNAMRTHHTDISAVALALADFAIVGCSVDGGGIVYTVGYAGDAGKSDADADDALAFPDAPSALLAPTISPSGGTYEYTTPVTMSSELGTKIHFSVNDESPVNNGQISALALSIGARGPQHSRPAAQQFSSRRPSMAALPTIPQPRAEAAA